MGSITGNNQKSSSSGWEKFFENMFSSSQGSESGTGVQSQDPWSEQKKYLLKGFQAADDNYNKSPTSYDGQMAADRSSFLDRALGAASNAGENGTSISQMLMAGLGIGQQAGETGANSITSLIGRLSQGPGATIEEAKKAGLKSANDENTTALVDAASRDIKRNLNENILPANNLQAVGTGNMNSSRTGIADGLAQRGAAEAIADTSAGIRGKAYDQTFNSFLSQNDAGNQGIMNSAGLLQGFQGNGMNAAGLANQVGNDGAQLYADMAGLDTADRQRALDGQLAKFQMNAQMPWMNTQNLWNIIGGANWGGTTTNNYANNNTNQTTARTDGQSQNANKSKQSGWGFGLRI